VRLLCHALLTSKRFQLENGELSARSFRNYAAGPSRLIKAQAATHIRSSTDTAMKNTALCQIQCHNIGCVIQSITS
jgi:hypothetical protein